MMRLIDADALKSYIDCGHLRSPIEVCFSELDVIRMLDKQPTIDAEPVRHGRWVMTLYTTTSTRGRVISNKKFACSECGYHNGRKRNKYCPNCGTKMDLKEEKKK